MLRRVFVVACFLAAGAAFAQETLELKDIPASEPSEEETLPQEAPAKPKDKPAKPAKEAPPEPAPTPPPAADAQLENNVVVLQGLNKVTGKVSTIDAPLGTVSNFGSLEIIPRRCWKAPQEERPENAALLEIRELKTSASPDALFLGWMFSSSPGLSSLEHPVYDITVLTCEARKDPENLDAPKK